MLYGPSYGKQGGGVVLLAIRRAVPGCRRPTPNTSQKGVLMNDSLIQRFQPNLATWAVFGGILVVNLFCSTNSLLAQKKQKIPDPKIETVKSPLVVRGRRVGDVVLEYTLYPSPEGKESVPVLLLHDYKGSRADFDPLAQELQKQGHCVIALDLRGHGASTNATAFNGTQIRLDPDKFSKADILSMINLDLEAIKSRITKLNNDGECNLDRLTIVGAGMGATVALLWTAQDWSWPALRTNKQGQFVKALVMLSPERNFKGVSLTAPQMRVDGQRLPPALQTPAIVDGLPIQIAVGQNSRKVLREAEQIHGRLAPRRPRVDPKNPQQVKDRQTLFFSKINTELQGTKLLDPRFNLIAGIGRFIEWRVATPDIPWREQGQGAGLD